uniref:ATP synthase F0 subunit 8 n=1 Tax=Navicula tsukamotoi TaxID=2018706 RepID=UPI0020297186|nr:ATP synthase F0 subunit 8 [Navicula tsukamotoi]QYB23092.1 ATP synthase F0 subunit 8 [Navicula tsukamotoi]
MAQFDVMISFSLIFNLLFVLYIYYTYNIQQVIPSYVETKKFRNKISSELNKVKTVVSLGSYTSILDFKYFKGFV